MQLATFLAMLCHFSHVLHIQTCMNSKEPIQTLWQWWRWIVSIVGIFLSVNSAICTDHIRIDFYTALASLCVSVCVCACSWTDEGLRAKCLWHTSAHTGKRQRREEKIEEDGRKSRTQIDFRWSMKWWETEGISRRASVVGRNADAEETDTIFVWKLVDYSQGEM